MLRQISHPCPVHLLVVPLIFSAVSIDDVTALLGKMKPFKPTRCATNFFVLNGF